MKHPRTDAKIDRIAVSWLRPTRGDAVWLAGIADEVSLPSGSALRTGTFSYVAIDEGADERIIGPDTFVVLGTTTTMLAIARRHRREAARRIPALRRTLGPAAPEEPPPVIVELRPTDGERSR
jgi:hypothetical protein